MNNRGFSLGASLCAMTLLAACGGTPRVPSDTMTQAVDLNAYTPKVDTFLVLLDSSDSMEELDGQNDKFQTALNSAASFNQAVPAIDIDSGLVVFGKGIGNCSGHSMAKQTYGVTSHNTSDFLGALSAIDCTGGSTPSGDALDLAASAVAEATGDVAVFIFSDFRWDDTGAVSSAVATMREQHGDRLCVHAIQVGDYRGNDALIGDITGGSGCGGLVSAADLASPAAMTAFVAESLMSPVPVVEYERQTLSATTLFNLNSAVLSGAGQAELSKLAAYINGHGSEISDIKVIGHTCDLGSESFNDGLSLRRAQTVAAFLAREGVSSDLMNVSGMGESSPIASNGTKEGRSQNRRVEVHIGTLKPRDS